MLNCLIFFFSLDSFARNLLRQTVQPSKIGAQLDSDYTHKNFRSFKKREPTLKDVLSEMAEYYRANPDPPSTEWVTRPTTEYSDRWYARLTDEEKMSGCLNEWTSWWITTSYHASLMKKRWVVVWMNERRVLVNNHKFFSLSADSFMSKFIYS